MNSFGEVRQIAYLTDDIETDMKRWASSHGVGPFTWYKNLSLNVIHLGEPSTVKMEVGIAWRGNMQIELIQQTNDAPSPYRPFFERGQMGLHHLAFVTEDMDQACEQAKSQGFEIITTIDELIGRYAYFQHPAMPENYFEFLQVDDNLNQYWQQCIEEAASWDGSNPVRVMDMSAT